jgi:predicted MFS family arabinose efflux permease
MSGGRLVLIVCIAQIAAQIGAYVWAALLPRLSDAWSLDNTEAGAITGAFYLAYALSAPILVSLTDRVDAKRIYLLGATLIAVGHLAFGLWADGFWTALIGRVLAGAGWAGVYMTGLKLLADRVDATLMRRAVAWHAGGIGVAGAASFLYGGLIADAYGWEMAFIVSAIIAALGCGIALVAAPSAPPPESSGPRPALLDFRPVLRNRAAMAFAITYGFHTWEMSVLRGWVVAFLVYVAGSGAAAAESWARPEAAAMALALIGTGVSMFGNELSIRIGRRSVVLLATALSAAMAAALGHLGPYGYDIAVLLAIMSGAAIWLDSSTLTGGTSEAAAPGMRGQTLAVHTTLGYAGGAIGPFVMGLILDAFSGPDGALTDTAWAMGFLHLTVLGLATRWAFARMTRDKT